MLTLLHLLSAVALLVWGTHIVRTGVMRVFGARLRTVLSRSVEKKPLAFCAGIGVTALVQSSNATTMLVTSFVAQDLVALAPALVIVLGADVGTALMARILTFDLSWLSPLLIFIGVIFFLGRKQSRAGQLGRVGIGLGLILLALELIVQAVTPITQANGVQVIFASLTGDILLDALIGAMFAIISYSSLAAVLLTATLTAAGIISFPVALCLVIGANLGSGLLAIFVPTAISEVFSYTPILGSACYIAFITGNVLNLKLPCAVSAMELADVAQGSEEGDAISTVAIAASSMLTMVVIALGVVLLVPLQPILQQPAVQTATTYMLPALFGSMFFGMITSKSAGEYIIHGKLKAVVLPLIVIVLVNFFVTPISGKEGYAMLGAIPLTILCAYVLYKKGAIKVELAKKKEVQPVAPTADGDMIHGDDVQEDL